MEQPREPRFYPNEQQSIFACGKENNTLQSIDSTLKRIEKLMIQRKNQSFSLDGQVPYQQKSEENSVG